ncbi:MAG: hypothetical protein IJ884_02220, partial [Bacteroidales bacterium]|nr:hypothetical protein [Bacteroidales bacterium]
TYGHHPSFALFSLGYELWGEQGVMREMVETFRNEAPQILYTNGTNAFLGYQGYVGAWTSWPPRASAGNPSENTVRMCVRPLPSATRWTAAS